MPDHYSEIDEVIAYIHQNLHDPLPLARLAEYVSYSPYHFLRMFKERVGLPPLYYVSALRLQKAKDLLLHTNLSIRDVGLEIGQQSLGTFTTRFTERVGMTPSDFRNSAPQAGKLLDALRRLEDWRTHAIHTPERYADVEGIVDAETRVEGIILIGLFPKPIPEGMPQYGTLLASVGPFCLSGVQPGVYYLMATAISWEARSADMLLPTATLRDRLKEPIIIERGRPEVPLQRIKLRHPQPDDPPILISLPVLMDSFLSRQLQRAVRLD